MPEWKREQGEEIGEIHHPFFGYNSCYAVSPSPPPWLILIKKKKNGGRGN
jgi:hypothetical protein